MCFARCVRSEAAIDAYDAALRLAPDFLDALLNRGLTLLALNRPMQALSDFDRVLRSNPHHVAALRGRAAAFRDLGEHDQALGAIALALAAEPDNREVAIVRCGVLLAMERLEEALAACDALIADGPSGDMLAVRANVLQRMGRREEALADAREAVRLAPDSHETHSALGIVLCDAGRLDEALAELDRARALGASSATFHSSRGVALSGYGDIAEALVELDRAVELSPADASARFNRAMTRLAVGDYAGGWQDYEARLALREYRTPTFAEVGRQWTGAEDVTGKKVLVFAEQGHGDTLQLIRFLPLLAERAAKVTLICPEPTRRLLQASFPDVDVTERVAFRQDFDFHVSVMSLPACFRTTLETLPRDVPYLRVEAERIEKWRTRLGDGFKIGLIWQGNAKYSRDRDRSIRLAHYAPLAAVPGVRFISLQSYGGIDQLADPPPGMTIETLGEEVVNNPDGFREVAAVMMNLDLIITSDTGPAHLAGALARPVWTALMEKPDWRWMRDRPDTPWYPTMRLFRQKTAGDWPGVFETIATELAAKVAGDQAG